MLFFQHMRTRLSSINLFLISLFVLSALGLPASAADFPFMPGEKITMRLKWGVIPAGTAVFEVLPIGTVNGQKAYHFVMTAESTKVIDLLYKVRDRVESYTNMDLNRSYLFEQKQHEGGTRRNIMVTFDWKNQQSQYSNFNNKRDPISILPYTLDPLSIFYFLRKKGFEDNPVIESAVTDGKMCVMGIASVIRRETIELSSGTYDTYLLEPEMKHIGGVFEKSKDAKLQVWFTADERRIPVKIKSKVKIGHFVGELISYENPARSYGSAGNK